MDDPQSVTGLDPSGLTNLEVSEQPGAAEFYEGAPSAEEREARQKALDEEVTGHEKLKRPERTSS